ncbi:glutathione S-transferase Mu 3-like isoform X2 [Liolophura sinensis]|uniref:glutathione S-transferase Mu 3-like isoform X2 n=1 Tax=Liolophura sinensis TaxID=3198878 RepID=UPI0031598321
MLETAAAAAELEDWITNCSQSPFSLHSIWLPYYIDGDMKITQSNAIMRYIGRKHNMLGSSEREKVRVDMMENQAMDFRNNVVRLCYNPEYEKLKVNYFKNLPLLLKQFEEFLGDDPWFGGKNITIVDFPMYELFDQHKLMESTSLDNFPKLCAFMKRFEELPNIKKYMSSDKFMSRPVNNKVAQFKCSITSSAKPEQNI